MKLIIILLLISLSAFASLFQFDSNDSLMVNVNNQPAITFDDKSGGLITTNSSYIPLLTGDQYFYDVKDDDVDIGAPKFYMIIPPNNGTRIYIQMAVTGNNAVEVDLYEDATYHTNGNNDSGNIFNSDRNSAKTSTVEVFQDTNVNNEGTLLRAGLLGSDVRLTASAGSGARTDQLVLKQNSNYILKISALVDNTTIGINFVYYEELNN